MLVGLGAAGRCDDPRPRLGRHRTLADAPREFKAVHAGHVAVGDEHTARARLPVRQRFVATASDLRRDAERTELLLQQHQADGVVVDQQHGVGAPVGRHRRRGMRGCAWVGRAPRHRQRHFEAAAAAGLAAAADAPAQVLNDLLAQRQAETSATGVRAARRGQLRIRHKEPRLCFRPEAGAAVLHREAQLAGRSVQRQPHFYAALIGELHGVGQQVAQHLAQADGVEMGFQRRRPFHGGVQRQPLGRGRGLEGLAELAQPIARLHPLGAAREHAAFGLAEVQRARQQLQQAVARLLHRGEQLALLVIARALRQQAGTGEHGAQRVADLVAERSDELALRRRTRVLAQQRPFEPRLGLAALRHLALQAAVVALDDESRRQRRQQRRAEHRQHLLPAPARRVGDGKPALLQRAVLGRRERFHALGQHHRQLGPVIRHREEEFAVAVGHGAADGEHARVVPLHEVGHHVEVAQRGGGAPVVHGGQRVFERGRAHQPHTGVLARQVGQQKVALLHRQHPLAQRAQLQRPAVLAPRHQRRGAAAPRADEEQLVAPLFVAAGRHQHVGTAFQRGGIGLGPGARAFFDNLQPEPPCHLAQQVGAQAPHRALVFQRKRREAAVVGDADARVGAQPGALGLVEQHAARVQAQEVPYRHPLFNDGGVLGLVNRRQGLAHDAVQQGQGGPDAHRVRGRRAFGKGAHREVGQQHRLDREDGRRQLPQAHIGTAFGHRAQLVARVVDKHVLRVGEALAQIDLESAAGHHRHTQAAQVAGGREVGRLAPRHEDGRGLEEGFGEQRLGSHRVAGQHQRQQVGAALAEVGVAARQRGRAHGLHAQPRVPFHQGEVLADDAVQPAIGREHLQRRNLHLVHRHAHHRVVADPGALFGGERWRGGVRRRCQQPADQRADPQPQTHCHPGAPTGRNGADHKCRQRALF